ncbi:MAG TPA: hypothetical protein VJ623_04270 [Holophagaceae bacterium]|nr:hypothetical protein [Holophagaceae bacterium]
MKPSLSLLVLPFALLGLVACGGGSSSSSAAPAPAATTFTYTDPAGTGWRLTRDASSTPTHLVLNLVGPAGTLGRGAAFTLKGDATRLTWGRIEGEYIQDAGLLELAFDPQDPNDPKLMVGGINGDLLMAGAFQKDRGLSPKDLGAPLFRVAIDFKANAGLHPGDAIPLTVVKARMLPDDLSTRQTPDITIATGTLIAH